MSFEAADTTNLSVEAKFNIGGYRPASVITDNKCI